MYDFLTTAPWPDYELLDAGNFQKLERFGPYLLARPEPQAIWDPHLPLSEWERADAAFVRAAGSSEKGQWHLKPAMPEQWLIDYQRPGGLKLKFRLGLSSFKHVGLFPEQDPNWQFIYHQTKARRATTPRVLNLFAYTGAATLAARAGGADVTHLDSVKQVNFWAQRQHGSQPARRRALAGRRCHEIRAPRSETRLAVPGPHPRPARLRPGAKR